MKIHLLTIAFIALAIPTSFAQVGINNTSPNSALDIAASGTSNNGLLVPTVDAFSATNPGADQDGMMVFLTTALPNYKKGHYYWDNNETDWKYFAGEWLDGYNADYEDLTYLKQAFFKGDQDVVILDNGRMGMGTDDPDESLEIKLPGDNDIQIDSNGSIPNAPNFIYFTKGGTFSSPARLADDKPISSLAGSGWTGSGESDIIGSITSFSDGNHSSGNLPTKFKLSVTGNNDDSEDDNGVEMTLRANGNIGIGVDNPTASLHLKGGTASANSAPLKLNAGTNLTSPEAGAIEYDGSQLYFTPASNRKILLSGLSNSANLDFLLILPGTTSELNISVPGAAVGDTCSCAPLSSIENNLKWNCYVKTTNTATIRLSNLSTGIIDPANKSWKVKVIK